MIGQNISPPKWVDPPLYPNADVRVVRSDLSKMGTIRVSDLLKPSPESDSENQFVTLKNNRFEEFTFELFRNGMMEMNEEIWWSAGPICNLLSKRMQESRGSMDLLCPLKNERILNGWNFEDTVREGFHTLYRTINFKRPRRLEIITFAMVIRPHRLSGEYRIAPKLDPMFVGVIRQFDGKVRRAMGAPYIHRKVNEYDKSAHEYCSLEPMESCTCGP